jgi:hypothetical protein
VPLVSPADLLALDAGPGKALMRVRKRTRAEAERQVARVVDQLETVRRDLLAVAGSLPEPPAEAEDLEGEADAEVELRRVVECVLADRIEWALRDLRTVLDETLEEPA